MYVVQYRYKWWADEPSAEQVLTFLQGLCTIEVLGYLFVISRASSLVSTPTQLPVQWI
jgi:hypothetical protein